MEEHCAVWLEVIGFLENDHIKQHCTITNQNFKEHVEIVIQHMRVIKAKPVTPYIHVLHSHVSGMFHKYDSIKKFNTSAQEHNTPGALTSHQLLSLWFLDLPSTTTPMKR